MSEYSKIYPDGTTIPESLPRSYAVSRYSVEKCGSCIFGQLGGKFCQKWIAEVRPEYWCQSWNTKMTMKNLHTSGNQYFLQTGESYSGHYNIQVDMDHQKYAYTGRVLTSESVRLLPYTDGINSGKLYRKATGKKLKTYIKPSSQYFPSPTDEDYINMSITRFFLVSDIEPGFVLELSPDDAGLVDGKTPKYNVIVEIDWHISGPSGNIGNMIGSIAKNERELAKYRKYTGLQNYLSNLSQLRRDVGTQENLTAQPGQFVYKDNPQQDYVGPYHIHPEIGPMVGAFHQNIPHALLQYKTNTGAPSNEGTAEGTGAGSAMGDSTPGGGGAAGGYG